MADSNYFTKSRAFTSAEIAEMVGGKLVGNFSQVIEDIATLANAGPSDLAFFTNAKYLNDFRATRAGLCIIEERYVNDAPAGLNLLVCENPYYAYAVFANALYPRTSIINTHQGVSEFAKIHPSVTLGQNCVIEDGVEIGEGTQIGHNVTIARNVRIGKGCEIGANSSLSHCEIGDATIIHNGVMIGQDGFGFAPSPRGVLKVPQLGRVIIGSQVEIGAGSCIDRGAIEDTRIGDCTKIDNLVQIGHNVVLGRFCFIAAQAGIAGSTEIGDGVMIGGQAGFAGHIKIGNGASVAAQSGVMSDVPPGNKIGGSPALEIRKWLKATALLKKMVEK